MKKELTEEDVYGMCTYLNGNLETVVYENRLAIDNERLLDNPVYVYGSFFVECPPKKLDEYLEQFGKSDTKLGQFVMILKDRIRYGEDESRSKLIPYQCVTMLLSKRDISLFEVLPQLKTLIHIGIYANDSCHFTLFIPLGETTPEINVVAFELNEIEHIIGLSVSYNRYVNS